MGLFSSKSRRGDAGLTVIDQRLTVRGDLETDGAVRVDGRVEGQSHRVGTLTVGPRGTVIGSVEATEVVIAGLVQGNVHATGRVEIERGARVRGDVHARALLMREGAAINGKFHIESASADDGPATLEELRPFTATPSDVAA